MSFVTSDTAANVWRDGIGSAHNPVKGDIRSTVGRAQLGDWPTASDYASLTPPASAQTIRTSGDTTPGDGLDALFRRVVSEPSHGEKIQAADGSWWERVENFFRPVKVADQPGGTAYARLTAALGIIERRGGGVLWGEADAVADTLGATVTFPSGTIYFGNGMQITTSASVDVMVETEEDGTAFQLYDLDMDPAGNTTLAAFQSAGPNGVELYRSSITRAKAYGWDFKPSSTRRARGIVLESWYYDKPQAGVIFPIIIRAETTEGLRAEGFRIENGIGWGTDPENPSNGDYNGSDPWTADFITVQGGRRGRIVNNKVLWSGSAGCTVARGCDDVLVQGNTFYQCFEPGVNVGSGFLQGHLADIDGWQAQTLAQYTSSPLPATSVATGGTARVTAIFPDSSGTGGWVILQAVAGSTLGDNPVVDDDWTQDGNATVVDTASSAETLGEVGRSVIAGAHRVTVKDNDIVDCHGPARTQQNIGSITLGATTSISLTAHGYSDGDRLLIEGITTTTELNGYHVLVANATTNAFDITDLTGNAIDTSGSDYTAYASGGGTVREIDPIGGIQCTRTLDCEVEGNRVSNPAGDTGVNAVTHIVNNARGSIRLGVNWYDGRPGEEISASHGDYRKTGGDSSWIAKIDVPREKRIRFDVASTGTVTNVKGVGSVSVTKLSTGTYKVRLTKQRLDKHMSPQVTFPSQTTSGALVAVTQQNDHEFTIAVRRAHEYGDTAAITDISTDSPAVVTANGHGFQDGDEAVIAGAGGVTDTNRPVVVWNSDANTFECFADLGATPVEETGSYTSGGTATRYKRVGTPSGLRDLAFVCAV